MSASQRLRPSGAEQAGGSGTGALDALCPIASHRDRLIDAATRVASEIGYEETDVERISFWAGLSEDEFFKHFDSREQCMLAAYDHFIERLEEHIAEACSEAADWPHKVKVTITAGFDFVREVETVARMFAIESVRIGPAALHRRLMSIEQAAGLLVEGRELYPRSVGMPTPTERTLVAGVVMLAAERLLGEDADDLADVEAEAVEMVLTPYIGPRRAHSIAIE